MNTKVKTRSKPDRPSAPAGFRPAVSEERLLEILGAFKKQQVAVLGDVGIDRYTLGSVDRISPEAPVPIVFVHHEHLKLGLAANVADNIVALGGGVEITGVIGKDKDAQDFNKLIRDKKIDASLVVDPQRRTILKERIVAETQQVLRVDYESIEPMSAITHKRVQTEALKTIKTASALIIEDYAKGLLSEEMISACIRVAKKYHIPVLVDPHMRTPAHWYMGADLLTPNKREAEALSGIRIIDDESMVRAGHEILKRAHAKGLIITLGREGMAIFKDAKSAPTRIPTFAQEVYDVSGAGDTVISVLALALASGADLAEAAFISNLAAGVEVSKRGTATVSQKEIVQAFLTRS
jgi:rfaE bifunctional protein kinase chain/domain